LFAVDADQANRTDADLLVDPLAAVVRRISVGRTNTSVSFIPRNASPQNDGFPHRHVGEQGRRDRLFIPCVGLTIAFPPVPGSRRSLSGKDTALPFFVHRQPQL
jgi:hypothetical protein